jgi:hypothetical protein
VLPGHRRGFERVGGGGTGGEEVCSSDLGIEGFYRALSGTPNFRARATEKFAARRPFSRDVEPARLKKIPVGQNAREYSLPVSSFLTHGRRRDIPVRSSVHDRELRFSVFQLRDRQKKTRHTGLVAFLVVHKQSSPGT